jgi:hypothetical protein
MEVQDVLQQCSIEGNVVRLPKIQLDRDLYLDVAKKINLIGGKWKGGKVKGFVFQQDPSKYFEKIKNGEKANIQKEYQFFETPENLADSMAEYVKIKFDIKDYKILEPSAGRGALLKAMKRHWKFEKIDCYELMELNRSFLEKIPYANIIGDDFLKCDKKDYYDVIIANPPFSKNQDIDHIYKMYEVLKRGGRIITISSKHWQVSTNKKEDEFKKWLRKIDAYIENIPAGAFKESGTMIEAVLLVIEK